MKRPKALIMAGGRGARLFPVTNDIPKPLAPVANIPVVAHALDALRRSGIEEAAITLGYRGDMIKRYFSSYGTCGVAVTPFEEETPLGTAGGAASARGFFDCDFIALGGDTLFDFDVSGALDLHRRRGALATIIVSHSDEPCRYGTVVCDGIGKIKSFCEKPEWKNVLSDKISTGIYVLSPEIFDFIPRGAPCDFAKDVFPRIINDMYAYETDGYFCDVGTLSSYLFANMKMSGGKNCVSPGANVSPGARVERSVILNGAFVGDGATVCDSIVCQGAVIMKGAVAARAVCAPLSVLSEGATAEENADISEKIKRTASKASAKARSRLAFAETAEEFVCGAHVISGTVAAPHGSAKTVGEMIRRGAETEKDGARLDFSGGSVTLSCVDADTLRLRAASFDKKRAKELFGYAENGVERLF